MKSWERISADPLPPQTPYNSKCFACGSSHPRRPSVKVSLTPQQIADRSSIETGDVPNPFSRLSATTRQTVLLCTACRDKRSGWQIIAFPRKFGQRNSAIAMQKWKTRCRGALPRGIARACVVCLGLKTSEIDKERFSAERNPSRDWTLFNILSQEDTSLTESFTTEFMRLSQCDQRTVRELLHDPSSVFLCYLHLNHSRYAQKFAFKAFAASSQDRNDICRFRNNGCTSPVYVAQSRLWRIPVIDMHCPSSFETFSDLEEAVSTHSEGSLHAIDVLGSFCCRSCHYIVMGGKHGDPPSISIKTLVSHLDRFLVRLRNSCILSSEKVVDSVRMLPFQEVSRLRKDLCARHFFKEGGEYDIDDRTLLKRLEPVLAGRGVLLKKLSYRLRYFVRVSQIDEMLSQLASSSASNICSTSRPSLDEIRSLLEHVASHFSSKRSAYWKGNWTLTEEVASIPGALWKDVVLQMASRRRLLSWKAAGKALGKRLEHVFPVSNCAENLPKPSIEMELHTGRSYSRVDLLLCVRALKVIEQLVLTRSNGVSGPLTISLSVSGICEVTPSFVSVLNAMGVFLSYSVTERYRQNLISERERQGPWTFAAMDEECIPVLQFDNWDIKPLHAVKVDGKEMPKVNGSLLQGQLKGIKRLRADDNCTRKKRMRTDMWKDPATLGSRHSFIENLTNVENSTLLQHFNNVVFGLVSLFRGRLVGGKEAEGSEYNCGTRADFMHGVESSPINLRTLLLSSFQPHGGKPASDESLYDQHVVYVEINRESAADILTVRKFLNLIREQLRPGEPGRPRYVVLGGDQPSYKMFVELWMESWRRNKYQEKQMAQGIDEINTPGPQLHEWLIPFPGFFHAEKQAMYSLCKEMLDGLGLQELAECSGLSQSHVTTFLKHSHARNNRAVLFNLACAMVIHLIDLVLIEEPFLAGQISSMHREQAEKPVSADNATTPGSHIVIRKQRDRPSSPLYQAASDIVTADVIEIGASLREKVQARFAVGPNGKHFVETVLFSCLLPTLGFHVLSRTGHTDLVHSFWFKHNAILHSSTHLKYQELSMFFAFFKGILPAMVADELFKNKPGRMVLKLPSFTGRGRFGLDRWGYGFTHTDEALEMLIVRHVKSLSVNFLGHLENSSAWLMQVSMFRALTRFMSGASRSYGRKREEAEGGEGVGPLHQFDRNACQWRTVSRMLHVMREAGFLNVSHRGAEWLTNVFSNPPKRMNIKCDQDSILDINVKGKLTSKLHASVLFPDVFGPLTENDREEHFAGKKFKKWTKSRTVLRPGKSMSKAGGSVSCVEGSNAAVSLTTQEQASTFRKPRTKEASSKVVQESRRKISRLKDALHDEQRLAMRMGSEDYLKEILDRWDKLHASRHLISPFADCFVSNDGKLVHGAKSKFLKHSIRGNRDIVYPLNHIRSDAEVAASRSTDSVPSRNVFEAALPPYYSVQLDVMNALHYRGDTGQRGTSLQDVVTGKMKSVLRPWVAGSSAHGLEQIHLHIDDATIVLKQKRSEQLRRDRTRSGVEQDMEDLKRSATIGSSKQLRFDEDLTVPWSSIITDREYKDELASLHLFCGAIAAFELLKESGRKSQVFLHGGAFVLPINFSNCRLSQFKAIRAQEKSSEDLMKGRVLLYETESSNIEASNHFAVPRSRCLIFNMEGKAELGRIEIRHGEAETRFVAVTKEYIDAERLAGLNSGQDAQTSLQSTQVPRDPLSRSVIVSDDTDVFMILLSNPYMHGKGVLHVLNDTVHDLDATVDALNSVGTCGTSVAKLYCLAGCDFNPSINGIGHELFWRPFLMFLQHGGSLLLSCEDDILTVDVLFCFLYLVKHGKTICCSEQERRRRVTEEMRRGMLSSKQEACLRRSFFVSKYVVGSPEWAVDVRNFIADKSNKANELLPHIEHLRLHFRRATFVAMKYWGRSAERDISMSVVDGCNSFDGYNADGTVLLEGKEDVLQIMKRIRDVFTYCSCKGECATRKCSCVRNSRKCIGCGCCEDLCENRAYNAHIEEGSRHIGSNGLRQEESEKEAFESQNESVLIGASNEGDQSDSDNMSDTTSEGPTSLTSREFEDEDIDEIV